MSENGGVLLFACWYIKYNCYVGFMKFKSQNGVIFLHWHPPFCCIYLSCVFVVTQGFKNSMFHKLTEYLFWLRDWTVNVGLLFVIRLVDFRWPMLWYLLYQQENQRMIDAINKVKVPVVNGYRSINISTDDLMDQSINKTINWVDHFSRSPVWAPPLPLCRRIWLQPSAAFETKFVEVKFSLAAVGKCHLVFINETLKIHAILEIQLHKISFWLKHCHF